MRLAHFAALGSTALLLCTAIAGCGDSTPAPERGGYSVEFTIGTKCDIQPNNGAVGTVTTTDPSGVVTDGTNNASIECTVAGSGTFHIDATANIGTDSLRVDIQSISTKNTESNPAKGSVSFVSPQTLNTFSNPPSKPCTFWFESGTNQTVKSGKIWASFLCDEVDEGLSKCALGGPNDPGVIVFEDCATSESSN